MKSQVIPDEDVELTAIHSQGAGGQNVNKVSSAIHLRFDIKNSSLLEVYKERLLMLKDRRINKDGVIIIKAQEFRTQEKNKAAALERLKEIISRVLVKKNHVEQLVLVKMRVQKEWTVKLDVEILKTLEVGLVSMTEKLFMFF